MICSKNIFCLLYPNILCVDVEEMLKEITPGYYDDVITDGLKADRETGVSLLFYNSNNSRSIVRINVSLVSVLQSNI